MRAICEIFLTFKGSKENPYFLDFLKFSSLGCSSKYKREERTLYGLSIESFPSEIESLMIQREKVSFS